MERSHRLLLVAGLLAALLPAAAATVGPQPGAPCDPTLLATQAALFCSTETPTARCCEPVVAAVDLGGGVPCLFRVSAEPQLVMAGLNASHLLKIYNSCGGLQDGACLAATCQGPAPPAAVSRAPPPPPSPAPRPQQPAGDAPPPPGQCPLQHDGAAHAKAVHADAAASTTYTSCNERRPGADLAYTCKVTATGPPTPLRAVVSSPTPTSPAARRKLAELKCEPFALGSRLVSACGDSHYPSLTCCEQIINTVDEDCVCDIIEVPEVTVAGIMVSRIWRFYRICGGTRTVPADTTVCREESPPPPPPPASPPPPPPSQGPPASTDESILENIQKVANALTASIATVGGLLLVSVGTGVWAWKHYSDKLKELERHGQGEVQMQVVQPRQQPSIIARTAARLQRLVRPAPTRTASADPPGPSASAPPQVSAASAPPQVSAASAPRLPIAE